MIALDSTYTLPTSDAFVLHDSSKALLYTLIL